MDCISQPQMFLKIYDLDKLWDFAGESLKAAGLRTKHVYTYQQTIVVYVIVVTWV